MSPSAFASVKKPFAILATIVLLAQAVVFYTMSHGDAIPLQHPFAQFPQQIGNWNTVQDSPIDQDTREVLGADDYLNRVYADRQSRAAASLYVAYWQTQQTGQAPHSPKNCLPGAGWVSSLAGVLDLSLPGRGEPARVNQYVVARGNDKALVLYWYQSRSRVVASEYSAKVYTVLDSLRLHRSDTALVRVLVPIHDGNEEAAREQATAFVRAFFQPLRSYLPA